MTTRSSPRRAMSPPMEVAKSYSSSMASFRSSTFFCARGVTRSIIIILFETSSLILGSSSVVRKGKAFR